MKDGLLALVLVCLLTSFSKVEAKAVLKVTFASPENFTDFSDGGVSSERVLADLSRRLEQHIQYLADRYLSKDDALDVTILDIDMAGRIESWRAPYLSNTRIMRDVYPPSIRLVFRWRDAAGHLKSEGEEVLSDVNYLNWIDVRKYNGFDQLKFEKTLLDRWFTKTFGDTRSRP